MTDFRFGIQTVAGYAIRDSRAEAGRGRTAQMAPDRADLMERSAYRLGFGPPAYVAEKLLEYVTARFEATIVDIAAPCDTEAIERLIGQVKPLVDRG